MFQRKKFRKKFPQLTTAYDEKIYASTDKEFSIIVNRRDRKIEQTLHFTDNTTGAISVLKDYSYERIV